MSRCVVRCSTELERGFGEEEDDPSKAMNACCSKIPNYSDGMKNTDSATPAPQAEPRKKRTRLTPEVRRQQILDAALAEFSAAGFTAASISRIASRAGISKANVYVHFASKDDMFETLLEQLLNRSRNNWSQLQGMTGVEELVERLIDFAYGGLTDDTIAITRLLLTEGHRMPHLLEKWVLGQGRADRQALIDGYVANGMVKTSPLTDHFSFVMAPVVYATVAQMVLGRDKAADEVEAIKDTHRKLLIMLLSPSGFTGQ